MAEIKERPILFSGPRVRAILAGQKTQTRRPIRDPCNEVSTLIVQNFFPGVNAALCTDRNEDWVERLSPFGCVGDRLWVRETHSIVPASSYCPSSDRQVQPLPHRVSPDGDWWAIYRADWDRSEPRWRPSIHMPRWASRITLAVTGVRVERVREISPKDCLAEGIKGETLPKLRFGALWNATGGKKPGCEWTENPWVWVIEFRVFA